MPRHDPPSPEAPARWKPAEKEPYFVILGDGQVQQLAWQSTPFDHAAWEFGNCFQARRDAESARDAMKACLWHFHAHRQQNIRARPGDI